MIEIIKEKVEMPELSERRFQKNYERGRWTVTDTQENKIVYDRKDFETASLVCHNLNKKFYRKQIP